MPRDLSVGAHGPVHTTAIGVSVVSILDAANSTKLSLYKTVIQLCWNGHYFTLHIVGSYLLFGHLVALANQTEQQQFILTFVL